MRPRHLVCFCYILGNIVALLQLIKHKTVLTVPLFASSIQQRSHANSKVVVPVKIRSIECIGAAFCLKETEKFVHS